MMPEPPPDGPDLDEMIQHAEQRWISILSPSHVSVREILMPLITAGHDRLVAQRSQ
jgi:hypothetical protein